MQGVYFHTFIKNDIEGLQSLFLRKVAAKNRVKLA